MLRLLVLLLSHQRSQLEQGAVLVEPYLLGVLILHQLVVFHQVQLDIETPLLPQNALNMGISDVFLLDDFSNDFHNFGDGAGLRFYQVQTLQHQTAFRLFVSLGVAPQVSVREVDFDQKVDDLFLQVGVFRSQQYPPYLLHSAQLSHFRPQLVHLDTLILVPRAFLLLQPHDSEQPQLGVHHIKQNYENLEKVLVFFVRHLIHIFIEKLTQFAKFVFRVLLEKYGLYDFDDLLVGEGVVVDQLSQRRNLAERESPG